MKTIRHLSRVLLAAALTLLATTPPPLAAAAIPNPSFELDNFTVGGGTINVNGPITGWTESASNRVGINPAASSPFADNGFIPNGTHVAFVQTTGGTTTLSTTITGLTAGTSYRVQFRANCRDNSTFSADPVAAIRLNGGAAVRFTAAPNVNVTGVFTNPYYTINAIFTATATTAALEISNSAASDSTLLVDNFTIAAATAIQVTSADNDGPGSLRQTLIAAAATPAFNVITFAPALSGQTITLLSDILVSDFGGVVIDASALAAGITIDGGPNDNRIFTVGSSGLLSLRKLTLTGGNPVGEGGAILNEGTLSLTGCTLTGNSASGGDGGAIKNDGQLQLAQCTLTGNHTDGDGGAIFNFGTLALTHCTISGNSAADLSQGVTNTGTMTIANCIIAGHSSGQFDLVNLTAAASFVGANVVVDIYPFGFVITGPAPITTPPLLDVLASNGGPTQTMALLPSSPARNTSVGSTITSDQRGKPIAGSPVRPDIGAFEVQSGGTFVFSQTGYDAAEAVGTKQVTIKRIGGFDGGPVTVKISTMAGTATAADFTVFTNQTISFADNEISKDVNITIAGDGLPEANESFKVTLSSPSAGTALGTPASATVVIRDDDSAADTVAPSLAPVITTPAANAVVNLGADGKITVTGTATDDKGVSSVEIRDLATNLLANATLSAPFAASTGWTATITPTAGTNTIEVTSFDIGGAGGNPSPVATRPFKVLVPLTVQIAGNGSVTPTGFTPSSFREAGQKFLITATPAATPAPGSIFKNWTLHGEDVDNSNDPFTPQRIGVPSSALEKPTLTFIHRQGLILRANFVPNPYAFGGKPVPPGLGTNSAGVSGVEYCGLIHADPSLPDRAPAGPGTEDGTAPYNSTEGLLKANVMSTGAFSGSLTIDGTVLNLAGAFDHNGVARFGTSRATTITVARVNKPSLVVELRIDLDAMRAKDTIFGTVTAKNFLQSVTEVDVSKVTADRAFYDGLTPSTTVDPAYLGAANATQTYTVVLPSRPPFGTDTATLFGTPFFDLSVENGAVGARIIFQAPAPAGITAGDIYKLVDYGSLPFLRLVDSNGAPAPITVSGDFTVVLPDTRQIENFSFTPQDYPQGDGYGFLTITKAGLVTLTAGKLADGSGWTTASTKLSIENKFPLFLQLYNKLGYLSGDVALDASHPDSDLAAVNLDWLRPFDDTSHYYPNGWEYFGPPIGGGGGIRVGFMGAKYAASFTPASSVLRRANGDPLLDADPVDGNAGLSFFDGQLTEVLDRTVSITTTNGVTNVPASDTSFTLTLTAGIGVFKGMFVHENDDGVPTPLKTDYEGVIYQKGPNAGGYGFFLTRKPTPIDYTGESGAVNLFGF